MKTLIVGMGARDRGDDAVGIAVAERVARLRGDADVRVVEATDLDLLTLLDGHDRLVVVDAMDRGDRAGTTDRIVGDAWRVLLRQRPGGSHAFGLAQALDLAERLHLLPPSVEVHLVQVGMLRHGAVLTPPVERAADAVASDIVDSLDAVPVA